MVAEPQKFAQSVKTFEGNLQSVRHDVSEFGAVHIERLLGQFGTGLRVKAHARSVYTRRKVQSGKEYTNKMFNLSHTINRL